MAENKTEQTPDRYERVCKTNETNS